MTTLRQTPLDDLTGRTGDDVSGGDHRGRGVGDLAEALDGLARAVERAPDDARTRTALAVVVQQLEATAGAGLGDTTGDPLVVLQRRFGRAHTRLAGRRPVDLDTGVLQGLACALQVGAADGRGRPEVGLVPPVAAAVLASC